MYFTALWYFYRSYAPTAWLMTVICAILSFNLGPHAFAALVILKLFTLGMAFLITHTNKKKEYFFYYNMGIPRCLLWFSSLAADIILFILVMAITNTLR